MNKEKDYLIGIFTLDGKPHEVSELGSLGLMAIGYRGLLAWREKRKQMKQSTQKSG